MCEISLKLLHFVASLVRKPWSLPHHRPPQGFPADRFQPRLSSHCKGPSWQQGICPQSTHSPSDMTDMARDVNTNMTGCGCREAKEAGRALTHEATHVVGAIMWIIDMEVLRVTSALPSVCFVLSSYF